MGVERTRGDIHIVMITGIAEHHGGVALQAPEFGAFHWRLSESHRELLLRHREELCRECPRILAAEELPRRERRPLRQLPREAVIPRAHLLGRVSIHPF